MTNIQITKEFKHFLDVANQTSEHIFLTGDAGSGKSTLTKLFIESTKKKVVVLAPTGVAAVNVGGQTVHSFFKFGIALSTIATQWLREEKEMLNKIDSIIIDEVSMLRVDMLDRIDKSLRKGRDSTQAFGGVQMIFVGDLFQIPPVIGTDEEKQFISKRYKTQFFFSAKVWQSTFFHKMKLTKVFRQKEDVFKKVLTALKYGDIDSNRLSIINNELHSKRIRFIDKDTVTVCCNRRTADSINHDMLSKIEGSTKDYHGILTGTFQKTSLLVPEVLMIKIGAKVMITVNDFSTGYVNGTTGNVTDYDEDSISVEIEEGKIVKIGRYKFEQIRYKYDRGDISHTVAGSFTQFPIMLAWGITIHKSQGKTLNKFNIDLSGGAFASGQFYVALSRATSLDGVCLTKPAKMTDIKVSEDVNDFDKLDSETYGFKGYQEECF